MAQETHVHTVTGDHENVASPPAEFHPKHLEAGHKEVHDPSSSSSLSSVSSSASTHQEGGDTTPPVTRMPTNVSLGPDNPVEHYTSYVEVPDSVYDRIPRHRKLVIVALLSYCAFLAPISSTTVLSATPEVAAEFHTTGSIVNVTNALYMLFMGISPIFWGPFSEVWGRKTVSLSRVRLGVISIQPASLPSRSLTGPFFSDHLLDRHPLHGV